MIAIISLLVSILLPSLQNAKELAKTTVCMSNLRMMGVAAALYTDEQDGWALFGRLGAPTYSPFAHMLVDNEYVSEEKLFLCPSEPKASYTDVVNLSYGINYPTFGAWPGHTDNIPVKAEAVSAFGNDSNLIYIADSVPAVCLPPIPYLCGYLIKRNTYPTEDYNPYYPVYTRHTMQANCLLFDTHVEALFHDEIKEGVRWDPYQIKQVLTKR